MSNKTVSVVTRVSHSIGVLLDQIDSELSVNLESSKHRKPHTTKDISIAVEEPVASKALLSRLKTLALSQIDWNPYPKKSLFNGFLDFLDKCSLCV